VRELVNSPNYSFPSRCSCTPPFLLSILFITDSFAPAVPEVSSTMGSPLRDSSFELLRSIFSLASSQHHPSLRVGRFNDDVSYVLAGYLMVPSVLYPNSNSGLTISNGFPPVSLNRKKI
jgi:hypothetical protein